MSKPVSELIEDQQQQEREKLIREIAEQIIVNARNTLLVNLRFLDAALSMFTYHVIDKSTIMTDGRYFLYNPRHILICFKHAKEIPNRDYLHVVLHCVFHHMFMDPSLEPSCWDLACDIAVEYTISELGIKCVETDREQRQVVFLSTIKKELKAVTAERIYSFLRQHVTDPAKLAQIRGDFYADNHEIWHMTEEQKAQAYGLPRSGSGEDGENKEDPSTSSNQTLARASLHKEWKNISERVQMDVEAFGKQRGFGTGSLSRNLQECNRERYDYSSFLKKFAVMGEAMKINDDEFDYIYYTYGLKLFEKMPLIEPLEYKEVKRIKDFVIAIDTSGSTYGGVVQAFLQKTYNIFAQYENFFTKINVHIIQCDDEIQTDDVITSKEEFERFIKGFTVHGSGGTDFRPVFEYVDKLIAMKQFSNLKGLIYFTDGYGVYPQKKPNYETAFVFVDDDYNDRNVPPWAIKLILQSEDITGIKQ